MYKGAQLCIPEDGDRLQWIREAHTSKVVGHFGVEKNLLNLHRYVFWLKMHLDVSRYIRGCILCNTSKPFNRKLGLYLPLPVPSRPLESISMDFLTGLPKTKSIYGYLFIVVNHFSKMVILISCKKIITGEGATNFFSICMEIFWLHTKTFGISDKPLSGKEEEEHIKHTISSNKLERFIQKKKHNYSILNRDIKLIMKNIMCHVTLNNETYYGYTLVTNG